MNPRYNWLLTTPGMPRMISEAIATYGVTEIPGRASNQKILSWAVETGLSQTYSNDDIPWCGLWMALIVKRSGREPVKSPLWARSWANWGVGVDSPELGDIVVFSRNGGGHVGLYVAEDNTAYHIFGGNQSNMVNITRIAKNRAIAFRRPVYRVKPSGVKKYFMDASGGLSTNEQ
jgi:uncharacterized protein (TIGR02594 family)